jgi:hypothetical protein
MEKVRYTIAEASKQFGIQINELTRAMRDNRLPKHTNLKLPYTVSYDDLTCAFPDLMAANDVADTVFTTFSASRKFFIEEWKIAKAIQSGSLPAQHINGSDVFTKEDFLLVFPQLNESVIEPIVITNIVKHEEPVLEINSKVLRKGPSDDVYLLAEDVARIFVIGLSSIHNAAREGKLKYRFSRSKKEFKVADLYHTFPTLKLRGVLKINTNAPVPVELLDKCYEVSERTIGRRIQAGRLPAYAVNGNLAVMMDDFREVFPDLGLRQYAEVEFVSEEYSESIISQGLSKPPVESVITEDLPGIIASLETIVDKQQQQLDHLLTKLRNKDVTITTPVTKKRWWTF